MVVFNVDVASVGYFAMVRKTHPTFLRAQAINRGALNLVPLYTVPRIGNDKLILSPRRKARKEKNEQMRLSLRLSEKIYLCNENDFQSLEQPMDFQSIVVELKTACL